MMSLGLLLSLFHSISPSSHASAFFSVSFILRAGFFLHGFTEFTMDPGATESNACNIHFLPLALSGKTTSLFHTEVPAKVPELTIIGTGWFTCSFLNQSPSPGRSVSYSSWASLVDTHSWSQRVEVGPFLEPKDWVKENVISGKGNGWGAGKDNNWSLWYGLVRQIWGTCPGAPYVCKLIFSGDFFQFVSCEGPQLLTWSSCHLTPLHWKGMQSLIYRLGPDLGGRTSLVLTLLLQLSHFHSLTLILTIGQQLRADSYGRFLKLSIIYLILLSELFIN